jgi:small subunit ribosomal protein S21
LPEGFLPLRPIREKNMLLITVKENESIDKALKRFKKKFERTGVLRELRRRSAFTKPSVARRNEVIRAVYKQQMREKENM